MVGMETILSCKNKCNKTRKLSFMFTLFYYSNFQTLSNDGKTLTDKNFTLFPLKPDVWWYKIHFKNCFLKPFK